MFQNFIQTTLLILQLSNLIHWRLCNSAPAYHSEVYETTTIKFNGYNQNGPDTGKAFKSIVTFPCQPGYQHNRGGECKKIYETSTNRDTCQPGYRRNHRGICKKIYKTATIKFNYYNQKKRDTGKAFKTERTMLFPCQTGYRRNHRGICKKVWS